MSDTPDKKPVMPAMDAGYEKSDTRGSRVFFGLILAVVLLVLIIVGLNIFYNMTEDEIVYENVLSQKNPRLQELRAEETKKLTSYAWVDSSKGIVRIPVDRAMELMVNEAYTKRTGHSS